ncbi:MAG: phenylacetate--CoA ligase [Chloroflexi bacterium]|nr:phenylacetate--CoA ligase [Chloroflexota bacterium]
MWNRHCESMSRDELERLQLARLQDTVRRAFDHVPFYRKAFDDKDIKPHDVKSLEDLSSLPFTTKANFRDEYPLGLLAVPSYEIVRIHASSGTTGKPVIAAYTRHDMDVWAEVMARVYISAGATSGDIVQNSYGYGLFTGGLGFHLGAEKIGAAVIPISGGLTRRQIMLMKDLGSTVLACTPSYSLVLAEAAAEMGPNVRESLRLRLGLFGAEPWSEAMRQEIEEKWGLQAINVYGLTEIIGPGVACECVHKNGLHVCEDHFLPEIIDPVTGKPLDYGQEGELVLTTLTKEALPVIRFRTRDRTTLNPERCACGRTLVRMGRITGRTDDMLIIRGVNVFPSQIEGVLVKIRELEPQYMIVVDRQKDRLDELEVRVEATDALWALGTSRIEDTERKVHNEITQVVGIAANVRVVEPRSIQRSEGKAKRIFDLREL